MAEEHKCNLQFALKWGCLNSAHFQKLEFLPVKYIKPISFRLRFGRPYRGPSTFFDPLPNYVVITAQKPMHFGRRDVSSPNGNEKGDVRVFREIYYFEALKIKVLICLSSKQRRFTRPIIIIGRSNVS